MLNGSQRVTFRPHPIEREKVGTLPLPEGVTIDNHSDIYRSFRDARIVISELSTGLFEAVALDCVPLVWSTPKSRFSLPNSPFQVFSSLDELEKILRQPTGLDASDMMPSPADFWMPDWQRNFVDFVEGVLEN
jgi:hypothetical protein